MKNKTKEAQAVLAAPNEARLNAALKVLDPALSNCATTQAWKADISLSYRFKRSTYVGMLAEAWVKQGGRRTFDALPASAAPEAPTWLPSQEGQALMARLASCVAHTHPDDAQAVVLSAPGSAEEAATLQKVVPHLKSCIGPREGLRMNRTSLRLALAIAVARRSVLPASKVN